MDITCPSGLSGAIRKFSVGNLDALLARDKRGVGPTMEFMLARMIWESTSDRGPYAFADECPPWDRDVLTGDRFYALMQSRIITPGRGAEFGFDVQCQGPSCDEHYRWTINLDQLPVKKMSEKSRALFTQGNRFEHTLKCGKRIVFSLPTGASQKRLAELVKEHGQGNAIVYGSRLREVEGVEKRDILKWVQTLDDWDTFEELKDVMDEADCGVQTAVMTTCPSCGYRQETEVGFGKGFFFPERKHKSIATEDSSTG